MDYDNYFQYKNVQDCNGFQSAESELREIMLPRYTLTSVQTPYLVI
jgi:hypothetical protein